MEIKKLELEYFIDYVGRRIHLLDKSPFITGKLVNVISPRFQKQFIEEEHLLIDVLDFEWLIYAPNAPNKLIFTYSPYQLQMISERDKTLHKPFLDVCGH